MIRHLTCVAIFLFLVVAVPAQGSDPAVLTLDRLHGSRDFARAPFGPARWFPKGGYTTLERSARGGHHIVLQDPATGKRRVLVPAKDLVPEGRDRPLGVADYRWSADQKKLLVFTNTRRVWRRHTRGDYWVKDLESGDLHQLGAGLDATRLQFAKFSPSADRVAYVHRSDLYVEDLAKKEIRRLTKNGSATLINGTFDWVYEEEWGLRDGFRWSPDGRSLAFWQIDASGVRDFVLIDYTSQLYPKLTKIPYPKVGEQNPAARVGVVPAAGGKVRWMDVPGDRRQNYIARMEWVPGSRQLVLQHFNRLQNTLQVMLADADTGGVRTVLTERDDTWVEVVDDLRWFDGGRRFFWVSERDGWRHLYVVSRDGQERRLVTPGAYDVVSVEHIDEQGGHVYFIASPEDPTRRFLFRVPLTGGAPERLTPKDASGAHAYQISTDARWAIHTRSAFGVPPKVDLVRLPDHATVRPLVKDERLQARVAALARGPSEFFRVEIEKDVELDGWMIKPPDFDPSKRYPLLIYVYGEPAGQTVLDRWGGGNYLWHLMLAQRGYVVASIDNRGTPAPRGRAWRKSVYGKIGILASSDQAKALEVMKRRFPFIDGRRIGIWGWSGGGSMSLNMIFRRPDLYHTAMAIAFVANQRYYDTIYQERYMGLPSTNPDGFRDGSPITHAKNLRGNLLLVYGTGDDNCHYQNCEALVNELIKHDKPFSMMAYPNRSHGIHEGRNTRRHLFSLLTRYLERNLPAGGR